MKLVYPRLYRVVAASILGGLLIGIVGGLFRYFLILSDTWRTEACRLGALHREWIGWMLPICHWGGGRFPGATAGR